MRRALPWLGLLLLALSFVWLVRQPWPAYLTSTAPRKPLQKVEHPLVVVLDAGHGGEDSGAMSGAVMEKDLTLDVALRTELLLRAAGYATVLTRESDRYLSLGERAAVANRQKDALFVSIHFNDEKATASGVETYFARRQPGSRFSWLAWLPFWKDEETAPLSAQSESLARFIQMALVERTGAVDRGTKSEQFYVIRNVRHPAALVEGGFITNKSEMTKLGSAEYRDRIASAISDGITRFRAVLPRHQHTLAAAAPE